MEGIKRPASPVQDPYALKASQLFGVPLEAVTQEQRSFAKAEFYRELYSYRRPLKTFHKENCHDLTKT